MSETQPHSKLTWALSTLTAVLVAFISANPIMDLFSSSENEEEKSGIVINDSHVGQVSKGSYNTTDSHDTSNSHNTSDSNNTNNSHNTSGSHNISNSHNTNNSHNTQTSYTINGSGNVIGSNNTTTSNHNSNNQTININSDIDPEGLSIILQDQDEVKKQRLIDDRKQVYKTFTDKFGSHSTIVYHGNFMDTLKHYRETEDIIAEIELSSSPVVADQAQEFYKTVRDTIACAWNEANKPSSCNLPKGQGDHPNDKYYIQYRSVKAALKKAIKQT